MELNQWSPDQPSTSTICEPGISLKLPSTSETPSYHPQKMPAIPAAPALPQKSFRSHICTCETWWCPSNFPQRWPNWNIMALYHATKNLKNKRCSISTDLEASLTRCALCWKLTQEEDDKEISQGQYHRAPTLLPQPFSTETILWVHSWLWLSLEAV